MNIQTSTRRLAVPGVQPVSQAKSKSTTQIKEIAFQYIVLPYLMIIPLLYLLGAYAHTKRAVFRFFKKEPRINVWCVDGISKSSRAVRDGAATFRALEECYNRQNSGGSIDRFWMHVRNAQAVWNRLQIVRFELVQAIRFRSIVTLDRPVRILSIAAGSAQAVIEAIIAAHARGIKVEALLLDLDRHALKYARKMADEAGVGDMITTKLSNVLEFEKQCADYNPDIVEMAGLIDYLSDTQIVDMFKRIKSILRAGGYLITCHIHPNHEAYFLLHVVNWKMLYRTRAHLEELLAAGGFGYARLETEPHHIHTVAIGTT